MKYFLQAKLVIVVLSVFILPLTVPLSAISTPLDDSRIHGLSEISVDLPNDSSLSQSIVAGFEYSCRLDADGLAYCWGSNRLGALGDGTNADSKTPVAVKGRHFFQSLSASWNTTCGLTFEGKLYCWGSGSFGQLGNGNFANSNVPVSVSSAKDFRSKNGPTPYIHP